jgi:uncharacterized coiled-coil DUF342 family protein
VFLSERKDKMDSSSISQCKGKGSIGHNNREYYADNIDRERTPDNIIFVNQPIGEAYNELFGDAVQRYNDKQKRPCRRIKGDYYENLFKRPPCNQVVESTCKRKSFYEDLVQVGDKDDCGCGTANGKIAEKCLTEYMNDFHKRNPNFHVFNAVLHVDEATPHLHINYIPVGHYKRGMDTQNGYNQALSEMGFTGADCFRNWRERERQVLRDICKAHSLEIKPKTEEKGRGHSLTVTEYKEEKDKITAEFETRIKTLEKNENALVTNFLEVEHQVQKLKAERDELNSQVEESATKVELLEEKRRILSTDNDNLKIKHNNTWFELTETQRQNKVLAEKNNTLENKILWYQNLHIEIDKVDDDNKKLPLGKTIVNTEAYEKIKEQAKSYRVNCKEITKIRKDKEEIEQKQIALDKRYKEVEQIKTEADKKYELQANLNREYQRVNDDLQRIHAEVGNLRQENTELRGIITNLKKTLANSTTAFKNAVKAVGMLRWDESSGYKVESLTPKQERLIDGIANHARNWFIRNDYREFAEDVSKRIDVSSEIEAEIDKLTPKPPSLNRGRSR